MKYDDVLVERIDGVTKSSSHAVRQKRVPVGERAYRMNDVVGINGYRVNRNSLKRRFAEAKFSLHETPHFLICSRQGDPTILIHWFAPDAIDSDLGQYFIEELKPLGLIEQPQSFGDVFCAIVGSLFPKDLNRAWHLFGTNTLQRYHTLLSQIAGAPNCSSPIDVFTSLYRRVCELCVGETLLDAGCSFGLLPLVVAERIPSLAKVVGVDIETQPFVVTRRLAEERHLKNVQFLHADLLADGGNALGCFDTVTVLHVLEHFTENEMYQVLENLVQVTSRRLIIGVPYETGKPESAFGHQQLFTPEKLESVGRWCIDRFGGGSMSCEECAGGLLYVDRPLS